MNHMAMLNHDHHADALAATRSRDNFMHTHIGVMYVRHICMYVTHNRCSRPGD